METVTVSLLLLLAVIVSSWLGGISPLPIPLPLVQIALGAAIASTFDVAVKLDPEVFFLLFLPPLLFFDGWRVRKKGLLRDKETILALAFGLVIFTVFGLGFYVHWLIPGMPLATAFAFAAIVSPTDPVALSAIATRIPIPRRLMDILEGESLFNDASGLVSMRFAVNWLLVGTFSLGSALWTFGWLIAGGVATGLAIAWAIVWVKNALSRRLGEEPGSQVLISLLMPFGAYLLAERLGGSGILAAVAAGISMSHLEQSGRALPITRLHRATVWNTIAFAANGAVFVLLGEQLPSIVGGAADVVHKAGHQEPVWLLLYVIAITFGLACLRFIWVWVSICLMLFRAAHGGARPHLPSLRLTAAIALAGARGAVTLAGVLTLPLAMKDGSSFPGRELAVFLAAGVTVMSLIAAGVGLPFVLRGLNFPPDSSDYFEEYEARIAAANAAIRAVEQAQTQPADAGDDPDMRAETLDHILEFYRHRIERSSMTGSEAEHAKERTRIERKLWLVAMGAERAELYRLSQVRELSDDVARRLVREIDLMEAGSTPIS